MIYKPSFPERTERLNNFVSGMNISQDFPLLKAAALPSAQVDQLGLVTKLFIVDTLQAYHGKTFHLSDDLLTKYREEILSLPNITPNGLFLPKRDTNLSFNAIHHTLANIMDSLSVESRIDRIHVPISIRLVNGASDPALGLRPRASTKAHLDIWAGEPTHAYMVFIPLLGDTKNNGVSFFEPKAIPEKYLKPLNDYQEGQHLLEDSQTYDATFRCGEMLFVDPFLLHQTMKQSPELRLSLEFRVLPQQSVSSDLPPPPERMDNYIEYKLWREIGRSKVCVSNAPLQQYRDDDKVRNEYASSFNIQTLTDY